MLQWKLRVLMLFQARGQPGAITPLSIHTFPVRIAGAFHLTLSLYGLHDTLQLISELQDLPYEIETSGDDYSAWR